MRRSSTRRAGRSPGRCAGGGEEAAAARADGPGHSRLSPDQGAAGLRPVLGRRVDPAEAQRLGLRAYGSDLNPVAVLIGKALVEIPPKFAGLPPVNPKAQA